MCGINDKNWVKEQYISLQTFHRIPGVRIQKITVEKQIEPSTLESFDPVTQEYNREEFLQQSTHNNFKAKSIIDETSWNSLLVPLV
jgi:hypothetical protein